ncbi:MAG: PhoH family protein [Candidatus Kapabacteria bacterium]|jgi:phosphate starvation-inducible PhoH-like protein|nr:PhoH family protein [Candidatus Kapabacteria bacterium]
MNIVERKLRVADVNPVELFGSQEAHLQLIENKFDTAITVRGDTIIMRGEPAEVRKIESIFTELMYTLQRNGKLSLTDVSMIIDLVEGGRAGQQPQLTAEDLDSVILWGKREVIRARTPRQLEYYKKVRSNDIVFCIGPAGTGKTFLAVAMALAALRANEVSRIILSRPAVEAGESLGFLPGDISEKIDPYLRPLLDALGDMVSPDKLKSMLERRIVEIIPLAFMRGRTLNNSFIILDEAQNSTKMQMKMFLTRLGQNSKAIITGDVSQVDLSSKTESGLLGVHRLFRDIKGIEFVEFEKVDVVRHRLVMEIVSAYEREDERRKARESAKPGSITHGNDDAPLP